MRTPEELLEDLETCRGPCGDICISCREAYHLKEIHDVLEKLLQENKQLRMQVLHIDGQGK